MHAQTVHAFLQDYLVEKGEWSKCTTCPLSTAVEDNVLFAWIIAHSPLFIQHGMRVGKIKTLTTHTSVERIHNLSMGLIQRLLKDAVEHIRKGSLHGEEWCECIQD